MATGFYFGDENNKARLVVGGYIGVDGVARKIISAYVGDENGIARLCWGSMEIPIYKITYNANSGTFSTGDTTNIVEYKNNSERVTKISKSSNVSDDGLTADTSTGYGNNLSITDVVTIPNSKLLEVKITYQTEGISYDWACIYGKDVVPSSSNSDKSISGRLGGTAKTTKIFTVSGDTAQIYFRTDGNACSYYGYYATITGIRKVKVAVSGEELIPTNPIDYMKFDGWYTNPECTDGNELDSLVLTSDIEVYAKWVDARESFAVYSDTDNSLRFYRDVVPNDDSTEYNGLNKTAVYTNIEDTGTTAAPPWSTYKSNITKVVFEGEIKPKSTYQWFNGFSKMTSIEELSNFDTSNTTNMYAMFANCSSLTELTLPESFNTSNVTDMLSMFRSSGLTSLTLPESFDTSNVTTMNYMFCDCSKLTSLTLSESFDTSNVTSMSQMFCNCSKLTSLTLPESFDTSKVDTMYEIFRGCYRLKEITLGSKFKWVGTNGYLPVPNSSYITGADGKWYNEDNTAYTPEELATAFNADPVNMAGTYYAVNQLPILMYSFNNTIPDTATSIVFTDEIVPDTYSLGTTASTNTYIDASRAGNKKVVAWMDGDTYKVSTQKKGINVIPYSCSGMFESKSALTSIDLSFLDTSNEWSMVKMFKDCSSLSTLKFSKSFDTSNVTSMQSMFSGCSSLKTLELPESFNTSKVSDMWNMFTDCSSLTELTLPESFDTSNVTTMSSMFVRCSSLTELILPESFNTSKVTDMYYMFAGCSSLTSLTLPESFDTSNVSKMTGILSSCYRLKEITLGSKFKWNGTGSYLPVPNSSYVPGADGKWYNDENVGYTPEELATAFNADPVNMAGTYCSVSPFPILMSASDFRNTIPNTATSMVFTDEGMPNGYSLGSTASTDTYIDVSSAKDERIVAWLDGNTYKISTQQKGVSAIIIDSCYGLFNESALTNIDLSFLDTSSITNMSLMFNDCSNLETLILSESFETSNVTDMGGMFSNCSSLTSLILPESFNTSNVIDMHYMFNGCSSLTTLTLPEVFNTSKVTHMSGMFKDCSSLTELILPESFNTSNVTTMSGMFMFCSSLTELTLPESFNTSNVTDMSSMFYGCNSLTSLTLPESFNTSNVTYMTSMFTDCSSLTSLILPESFDTGNVIYMHHMFSGCSSLTELTLPESFNTSNVTTMSSMFYNCSSLTSLTLPESFNTSNVTAMSYMFNGCSLLTDFTFLDKFDTSNVTTMQSMFRYCSSLTSLTLPESFNTSNVTDMRYMFAYCSKLISLTLPESFDTGNVTDMGWMFTDCENLITIYAHNDFNTSKVTDSDFMFYNCKALVGGNGTAYDSNNITHTYARIDREGAAGYFTQVA